MLSSNWVQKYDITQEYDKNGNRTRLHRNTTDTSTYGRQMDLGYTFDNVNALTALADSDDATYSAVVTCDPNGNITGIEERKTVSGSVVAHEYQYYAYDDLNRLSNWRTKTYSTIQSDWKWRKREHLYDGQGRLVHSTRKEWWDSAQEPSGDSLEHIYAGSRHIGNTDGSSNYGTVWNWAGAQNSHAAPLRSPNADTASQKGYNVAASSGPGGEPQRRTFLSPTSEGNKRLLYAQGEPLAKDSSGSGANWRDGLLSDPTTGPTAALESRIAYEGTVSATDLSRATDAREKERIGVFGTSAAYAGSSGRVTSQPIGRDLNPLGRGDGMAYVAGQLNLGRISTSAFISSPSLGQGNSVNNTDPSPWSLTLAVPDSLKACCHCINGDFCALPTAFSYYIPPGAIIPEDHCCPPICSCALNVECVGDRKPYCHGLFICDLGGCDPCKELATGGDVVSGNRIEATRAFALKCLRNYLEVIKCNRPKGQSSHDGEQWASYYYYKYLIEMMKHKLATIRIDYGGCCFGIPYIVGTAQLFCCTATYPLSWNCLNGKIIICPYLFTYCANRAAKGAGQQLQYGVYYTCCLAKTLLHEISHSCAIGWYFDIIHNYAYFVHPSEVIAGRILSCCGCPGDSWLT